MLCIGSEQKAFRKAAKVMADDFRKSWEEQYLGLPWPEWWSRPIKSNTVSHILGSEPKVGERWWVPCLCGRRAFIEAQVDALRQLHRAPSRQPCPDCIRAWATQHGQVVEVAGGNPNRCAARIYARPCKWHIVDSNGISFGFVERVFGGKYITDPDVGTFDRLHDAQKALVQKSLDQRQAQ
jgi:hypothetical protein